MGTNYYHHTPQGEACPHCGRADNADVLHIGKSSGGWVFALHVIPESGINDLEDWRELWKVGFILDEYGERVTVEQMEKVITGRDRGRDFDDRDWGWYGDEATFHRKNLSERGPNGLLRHQIGRYCVKHGAGTWDCMPGEFS